MAARHNPRRNVGAPVRFEDDDAYLEPPRDTTKPAWPKLLAQSTVPYDQTLAPVKWNTRPLDQPCSPRRQQALEITQEDPAYETAKEEDYSKQLSFEANCDLDMSTSESEGEGDRKDHERTGRDLIIACDAAKWSSLEPALQLSIYEYVYRFLSAQGTSGFVEAQGEIGIRALAAEVLGLSSEELSEIDTQRAFLAAHPMTEDYIQALCWQHEETTMIEEDPLSKDICQYRGQWQEINSRYTALMLYICKYKYTNERAIHLAKEYVKVRGLKPKVVGKWTEGEEETTMVFVSFGAVDPKSPILLPVSRPAMIAPKPQTLQKVATLDVDATLQPLQSSIVRGMQSQPSTRLPAFPLEISNVENSVNRNDPTLARPKSAQQHQRGRSPVHPCEIHLTVNSDGTAEIRKKHCKRRAESELRRSRSDEYVGRQRIVVRADGIVGVEANTKLSTEVEGLLQTGIEASRHGKTTGLTNRMQKSLEVPTSAQELRPRRFSDILLGIDSNYMATATAGDATDIQERQPLLLTSTPPQPAWSPIANPSPSPSKSTPGVLQGTTADVKCSAPAVTPQGSIKCQPKSHLPRVGSEKRAPVQFDFGIIAQDIASSKEIQASHEKASRQRRRSSSLPPLLPPEPSNNDHDSGIGTSRSTSTKQEASDRVKKDPSKTPRPKPKQPEATLPNRKLGRGARGGPGAYKKKQKAAKDSPVVAASPLAEKTNIGTSSGTN